MMPQPKDSITIRDTMLAQAAIPFEELAAISSQQAWSGRVFIYSSVRDVPNTARSVSDSGGRHLLVYRPG